MAEPPVEMLTMKHDTVILKKKTPMGLWSENILNNWFFVWVVPVFQKARNQEPLHFKLREQESARTNADALERAFDAQPKSYFVR
jgi:hypothetical protein